MTPEQFLRMGETSRSVALDLLAREEMGLMEMRCDQIFEAACEATTEHVRGPGDGDLDAFSMLVGAGIASLMLIKGYARMQEDL